ncbi:BCCT family transporter [Nocardia halotolerans]|uniref:BCCT family transporter n=1 Tax=Nocardia halotolerans TaxID=1755878 RepID=A0ABV8VBN3_9NOCA
MPRVDPPKRRQHVYTGFGLRTDPYIFFISAGLVALFVFTAIVFTKPLNDGSKAAKDWIVTNLSWFFIFSVTGMLLFLIWIALSKYGNVRLGAQDSKPEYSNLSWFGMLFAAGIGTVLMFWGVAEPISHFGNPPREGVEPESVAAADDAMAFSLYHLGLHTWAIFCLPALAFAYFIYRRGLPMRMSSAFHPLLGDRIYGPIGKAIDILAVLGTLFGVATSIGLGTLQINSGLNYLSDSIPVGKGTQITIIAVVTAIATLSVAVGLDKGIKRLSNLNIMMAIALLIFVFVAGSSLFLARGIFETFGNYLGELVGLSFWNDSYANLLENRSWGWQGDWTVFYWAWTITWAPFVGIFVARISKGRTIRDFVLGVLAAPTAFTIVWFSIFGLSAIDIEINGGGGLVEEMDTAGGGGGAPFALFTFLENFPLTTLMVAFSVLIVVIFFTTSSDSASLVVDMLCSGEQETGSPTRQRVFWAITEGVVGGTLLAATTGSTGLEALREVITVAGLPFHILAFFMMWSLVRALREDVEVLTVTPREKRPVKP